MLTEEQKKKYLEAGGNHCPFCGSEYFSGGPTEREKIEAWQTITCDLCRKKWDNIYILSDIEEVESK